MFPAAHQPGRPPAVREAQRAVHVGDDGDRPPQLPYGTLPASRTVPPWSESKAKGNSLSAVGDGAQRRSRRRYGDDAALLPLDRRDGSSASDTEVGTDTVEALAASGTSAESIDVPPNTRPSVATGRSWPTAPEADGRTRSAVNPWTVNAFGTGCCTVDGFKTRGAGQASLIHGRIGRFFSL